ncbi:SDR family oxidoreductase [Methylococcus sp. ANG]|uniref:SDR family oxidoreductase n=1 Tax=Methylococcus sp. ANG TaxID=3231903 RepID=UPI00345ADE89
MQDSSRSSRAILITGCSSGIGLCTALGLKARGYRVFASARKAADVAMLQSKGLEAVRLDLACSASIRSALEEVLRKTDGKLYGLFNNGAFGQPGAVEDLSREALRAQFETNLFGTHELTRLVIPVMRRQGEGRILQNSSVLGFAAMPWRGAYNASKFALEGLTDTLRMELADSGIHVCLIEPGPILSEFRANAYDLYKRNIDAEASMHRERYRAMEARLEKKGAAAPFTEGPEAVLKRVIHALESRRPKARYCVTFPTYLFATLKRVLSTRALDAILRRID